MNAWRLVLVVLALITTPAAAQPRNPGAFDYYLLSLSVAPSFCTFEPEKSECRSITPAQYQATPLTIHGLWPNLAHTGSRRQPQYCDPSAFSVSPEVRSQLARLMPAGPGLANYEWRKHGTCSGLTADQYFGTEAHLAQQANTTIGAAMLAQGDTIRIADLLQAIAARDPALATAVIVDCRTPRGGGPALVAEIRVTLSKDFQPIPAASVGMGQNSGCPGGAGRIPVR